MHELKLIKDLTSKLERLIQDENIQKINGIDIWLGALSHLEPETFGEQLKTHTENTMILSAKLTIEKSTDIHDEHAQYIILKNLDVE